MPDVQKLEYDALGRLTQDAHRTFKWTSFDLPKSVTENGEMWTFGYDAGHVRVTKAGPKETITSFGGLYEKHETPAGTRHVFHLVGSDVAIGEVTYTENATPSQPGTTTTAYALTDALGSTLAVADDKGTVAENDYFDLWGQRTKADGAPIDQPTLFQSLLTAGFTSQPHDDDLAVINMQGRLYDPALGRFLSADPIVGNAGFSQSWNAYSYVLNSPVDFIDPSGFECSSSTTVSDGGKTTSTLTGCHDDGPDGSTGAHVATVVTFLQDQERWAHLGREIHELRKPELATSRKSADGTPIGAGANNWGWRVRPTNHGSGLEPPRHQSQRETDLARLAVSLEKRKAEMNRTSTWLEDKAAGFTVRLFCGRECASANGPTSAREAAAAPKRLSDARIARNAVSQALAAKSLFRWIGKVGVLVDEGVDGVISRLMPDGLGMDDEEEDRRRIAEWIAEGRAMMAQAIELAEQNYQRSEADYRAAVATRDRLHSQYLTAESDLLGLDPSDVAADLLTQVFLDSRREYEEAVEYAMGRNFRAQVDYDWWQQLRARARTLNDGDQ
jgi:RHS repeat-associated protein